MVVNSQEVTISQEPGGNPAEINGMGKGPVVTTLGNTNLEIDQLILTGGNAPSGGGIDLRSGTITIRDSTIAGNTAAGVGWGYLQRRQHI